MCSASILCSWLNTFYKVVVVGIVVAPKGPNHGSGPMAHSCCNRWRIRSTVLCNISILHWQGSGYRLIILHPVYCRLCLKWAEVITHFSFILFIESFVWSKREAGTRVWLSELQSGSCPGPKSSVATCCCFLRLQSSHLFFLNLIQCPVRSITEVLLLSRHSYFHQPGAAWPTFSVQRETKYEKTTKFQVNHCNVAELNCTNHVSDRRLDYLYIIQSMG